jgi:ketol-acid reductoisomerase
LEEIKQGIFAGEWEAERGAGYPLFNDLKSRALSHPINAVEDGLKAILHT